MEEGKYIYCIIETKIERNFGPIGIGGRGDEVTTIGYKDLGMVISNSPMTKYVVSRENLLAHEKVVEEVMNEFTVLPVRFCTIASNADEIRSLLNRRHREFKNLLRDMDHKVELGIKGLWKNMNTIFKEITEDNEEIKKLKDKLQKSKESCPVRPIPAYKAGLYGLTENRQLSNSNPKPPFIPVHRTGHSGCFSKGRKDISSTRTFLDVKIEVGKLVEDALKRKKEKEAEKIVGALRRTAFDHKLNNTINDEMFINAAFLVDKGREKEFDNIMDDLSEKYRDRTKLIYVGPLPPYNFVNIIVYPAEWEK